MGYQDVKNITDSIRNKNFLSQNSSDQGCFNLFLNFDCYNSEMPIFVFS